MNTIIEIHAENLPIFCPHKDMILWSSHPKVFLFIDKNGYAQCPYCNTKYKLDFNKY
ncbi:zinc-finger domain-containing protein [Candidatus Profftella armatura (Diaphorina cf. continua)]|uniref:Zinc-finger domain-containing protein n=1 Tax=Candidatus Profftella armatura (Diaphorina cf. continua) TaxID=2661583 RepID=A0A7R6W0N8_9PROT|nr:zinc-finger domain-containing protein [Candidatus Profftella armatura (Diaphorina cf. continua)]BCG49707.1 zinc-finger domain-containing protein [Candidatus Profftella armatura (Diaphorina cf. continua)]